MNGILLKTEYGWYISHIEDGIANKYPLHTSDIDYAEDNLMKDEMNVVSFHLLHDWCGITNDGDLMSCDYGKLNSKGV